MKAIFTLSAAILTALTVTGQESIRAERIAANPVVNSDNTVTFSLRADSTAHVQLVTNFCEPIEMPYMPDAKQFAVTVNALEPQLYTYHFDIDGVRVLDPGSTYMLRDIASLENYFIIPSDNPDDLASLMSVNDVPHGTVSQPWYKSETIGRDRRLTVYTPAGYETGDARFPVLYLLHGSGGDENAWIELGRTAQILDNLIAQGKAKEMIVVMPNATIEAGAAPGDDERGHVQPTVRYPMDMTGVFEQSFPEIVDFIDTNYRTVADASHRAIAGLSMGGFHAKFISAEYPEMFGYVGLFSAAMGNHARVVSEVYADENAKLQRQMQGPLKLYWIGIGEDDFLFEDNVEGRRTLDALGFPYEYHQSKGGHQWVNWRDYLSIFARRLF